MDRVARIEYCVMHNGNNIECFDTELAAIAFAEGYGAEKILKVSYSVPDINGDERELSAEEIWHGTPREVCIFDRKLKKLICVWSEGDGNCDDYVDEKIKEYFDKLFPLTDEDMAEDCGFANDIQREEYFNNYIYSKETY